MSFTRPATCYRVAKQLDQCREYLMKAAECHKENRSLFHAARCYEQIILVLKEQNKLNEIEDLAHRACRLYQQQGSPEAGAGALDKASKMIESQLPESALNLYQHAVEVVMVSTLVLVLLNNCIDSNEKVILQTIEISD